MDSKKPYADVRELSLVKPRLARRLLNDGMDSSCCFDRHLSATLDVLAISSNNRKSPVWNAPQVVAIARRLELVVR